MNKNTILFLLFLSASGISHEEAFAYSNQEFAQVINPQEARIDQFRTAEIQQLNLVLSRSGTSEKNPEMLLRLAELYTEKYRLFFVKENEIWNKKIDAYLQLPVDRQKYNKKPLLDNSASKQWLTNAVRVLEKIPLQKSRFDRLDEVYYFLGFNHWELGNRKRGIESFEKIIENFPRSKFASEAYRYVADYAFANRDFKKSKSYYERAARSGATPARPRILYGLAWSQFKLKEYKKAVATMKEAIVLGRDNPEAAKAGLALQRDAADALAMFYSEGGKVSEAVPFFTDLFGENEAGPVLKKLAETYQRQGEYPKALEINKQLLAMGGAAAKQGEESRFEIMVDSLNISATKGDRARQAALLKSMTAEFVTNASNPDAEKVELLQTQVRRVAALAHKEGNKSGNSKEAFRRAEDLYRLYLSAFASRIKPEDAAEINYYLADVYSQLGRHKEAAAQYKTIMDKAEDDSAYKKYAKDGAAGMVFSLDNYFKQRGDGKKVSKADGDEVIAAIDSYIRTYPNDKDATKYLSRAAGILVISDRMDEARPRLTNMVEKYSNSKEAWDAASTLLKDAEERKDPAEAERLSKEFLSNRGLMAQDKKGEFRKKLDSIVARAQFQQVRAVEEDKDFSKAAKGYEKLAMESKDSEVRMKALNNAAVSYQKDGDRENERRVYEKILELDPDNRQAERNLIGMGNEHFLSGRYSEAADSYEAFFKIYEPKLGNLKADSQKAALESLRSAALLRKALKQNEKATEDFRKIVDAANKGLGNAREAAGEFLFDLAKRLRDEGNTPEAIRSFQKYSSAFSDGTHAAGANMETAILYEKLREEEKAQNYLRTTISKVKAKGNKASSEELGYAAQARLVLLGPLEETFEKAPLRLPEATLKSDINNKLQALERLNKGYIEVMDFGDGRWGVEAFRRMALAYRSFGMKLEAAPVPEQYSLEDKAKFKAQLKNVAKPVYVKVGETLETALQKGEQLQVVGNTMAKAYVLASIYGAKPDKLPLVWNVDWSNPEEWLMGEVPVGESELEQKRKILRNKPEDLNAWVAIGNRHLVKNEFELAEIFYLHALQRNPKHAAAINNIAYLKGKEGDMAKAMSGFKAALATDEFAFAPKKNMARLHMASGLWRHAGQALRQLEVRAPNDKEIKRGVALANLASGKVLDSALITQGSSDNAKFAEAILHLAKGDRAKSANLLNSLASSNEYAKTILEFWNTKESSE
jgi:cellulose synthase operon protein C